MLDEDKHIINYRKNIFKHKSFLHAMFMNSDIPSYGESYCFRGSVEMPKN